MKYHAEIRKKIDDAFERALDLGATKINPRTVEDPQVKPAKSLAEKSQQLIKRLERDPFLFTNPSPRGEVNRVQVPEKLQASDASLDIRCAGLYEQAVRLLKREKE